MSNERERALEAARRTVTAVDDAFARGRVSFVSTDAELMARALLASSPPPSCEMRKALEWLNGAGHPLMSDEDDLRHTNTIRAALDANRTEEPWQPIETAPKDGIFRVWVPDLHEQGFIAAVDAYWDAENGEVSACRDSDLLSEYEATHWMPRTAPPSRTEEKP